MREAAGGRQPAAAKPPLYPGMTFHTMPTYDTCLYSFVTAGSRRRQASDEGSNAAVSWINICCSSKASLTRVTKSYLSALGTTQISSYSPTTELSF